MLNYLALLSLYVTSVLGCIELDATSVLVSALVGKNDASAYECWRVQPPFSISSQSGTVGAKIQQIGDIKGGNVVFFDQSSVTHAGLHNAPSPQWVTVLAGNGTVTLPTTGQKLALPLGALVVANDTAAVSKIGHNTDWAAGSIAMQLPFANGVLNHTVVHEGPCVTH
ncbi:small secreted protein [Hysterangium stoloniferum]|nr:small secreted protein [Hysterangium stoloniferum]